MPSSLNFPPLIFVLNPQLLPSPPCPSSTLTANTNPPATSHKPSDNSYRAENHERAQVLLRHGVGQDLYHCQRHCAALLPPRARAHDNKLTAQLYGEFRSSSPQCGGAFGYYDYYQPEAHISVTDTFIEKDMNINEEVDKLRLRASSSLLSGRRDIIIVASVSCIYGMEYS